MRRISLYLTCLLFLTAAYHAKAQQTATTSINITLSDVQAIKITHTASTSASTVQSSPLSVLNTANAQINIIECKLPELQALYSPNAGDEKFPGKTSYIAANTKKRTSINTSKELDAMDGYVKVYELYSR